MILLKNTQLIQLYVTDRFYFLLTVYAASLPGHSVGEQYSIVCPILDGEWFASPSNMEDKLEDNWAKQHTNLAPWAIKYHTCYIFIDTWVGQPTYFTFCHVFTITQYLKPGKA